MITPGGGWLEVSDIHLLDGMRLSSWAGLALYSLSRGTRFVLLKAGYTAAYCVHPMEIFWGIGRD